jgi:hypothetical protein
MVWFYSRGLERRSCETRLSENGDGYELVIREAGKARVEGFADLRKLMAREHQLLAAWRAQGWSSADAGYANLRWPTTAS